MSYDYEKDISIDGEALDLEWLHHPSLVMKYTRHAADMTRRLDEAKQNLDIAKAEADKRIRKNPSKYHLEKITEGAVLNAILIEEGYKDAYDEYLSAKYESDMASAAVRAFDHRKATLENMVKLFIAQYFAGPSSPLQINREWGESKERGKKVSDKLNGMQRRNK